MCGNVQKYSYPLNFSYSVSSQPQKKIFYWNFMIDEHKLVHNCEHYLYLKE